jgi:hypothetical protein
MSINEVGRGCDYRDDECSNNGTVVNHKWICDKHFGNERETVTTYNANEMMRLYKDLICPMDYERLGRLPTWVRSLIHSLVLRIYNLRKQRNA